jgi:hypothetical protein
VRNVVAQKFTKGINARLPIDRFDAEPQRLHTLQNARLSSRDGNTYYAKRIDGATPINTEQYPVVLDILGYKEFVIILFKEEENSAFHYVDIVNVNSPEEKVIEKPFVYSDINTRDIGKLILLEDTVLISPHNKMLNYIFGAWNFNDFVSTTPTIEANLVDVEEVGQELSFFKGEIIVKSGVLGSPPPATPSKAVINFVPGQTLQPFSITIRFKISPEDDVIEIPVVFNEEVDSSDAALSIVSALISNGFFNNFWNAEVLNESILIFLKETYTSQEDYNDQYNNLDISFEIVADKDVQLDILDVFDLENSFSCSPPAANKKCGKTFGGRAAGSFGNVIIKLGNREPILTADFTVEDNTADSINAEIFSKISTVLEPTGDYQVDSEQVGETFVTTILATKQGLFYNLEPIIVEFPESPFFEVSTKIISSGKNIVEGDFDTTKSFWYKARNVYFDGHKTKTCFPVYSKPEKNSNNVELIISPDKDIDGTYTDVEIFRKSDDGDFYFIKKIKPQDIDPTKDFFVQKSEPAYRYIYTRSQNFPAIENKNIAFRLGDYTTDIITLTTDDTENSFIEKIYNAFLSLESFTSKWNIRISNLPKGIEISSSEISKSYNNIPLQVVSGIENSMVRPNVNNIGSTATNVTQTDTDQIAIIPVVVPIKLFSNDIIRITKPNGLTQDVTVSTDYTVTETDKLIPIKETVEIIEPGSSISFVSGEVFSDFGLIRSTDVEDPFVRFYDTGFKDIYVLDEKDYIWSRHHYTHEVARDRYVRANVDYDLIEDVIPEFQFTLEEFAVLPQENTSPFFTNGTLFAQARFQDGTTSFFEEIGSFSTETESESFFVTQENISDENVKEYAFYAQYKPKNNPFIELNAASFSNALLPTEFTSKYLKGEDGKFDYRRQPLYPINPRFFVGFGRVYLDFQEQANLFEIKVPRTSVYEWLLNEEATTAEYVVGGYQAEQALVFPEKITLSYFGLTLDYVLEKVESGKASYILMALLGIKTLSEKVNLFYEIKEFSASTGGFGGVSKDDIINRKYKVLGYELVKDPSSENDEYDGALFIRTETNTPLDRVQAQITKKTTAGTTGDFDYDSHPFNLQIAQEQISPSSPSIVGRLIGVVIDELNVFGVDEKIDSGIFLGSKLNEINTSPIQLRTGYDTDKRFFTFESREVNVFFSKIQIGNIYASIFLESDIPYQKEKYPNQIIWSDPFVLNSNASGYRNFRPNAFLNIGADYGKIVGIEYVNNRLLVFTEHGLAVVNVGEVLTQQIGGQVFVDSSGFLNGYAWALKELPMVMPKTIVQYENMVFFCDGQDVWMYDGELKNISQGAVILSGLGFGGDSGSGAGVFMGSTDIYWGETSRYMGEDGSPLGQDGVSTLNAWVGAIDPYNKEYRITDSFSTYAYSIEFNEWFGPYTYKDQASDSLKNRMYSVVDGRLVRQNEGTLFVETPYETTIESVANLLDRPDAVKNWRKFYVDFETNGLEPSQYNPNFINFESYAQNQPGSLGENRVLFGYRKHKYIPFEIIDLGLAKVKNNSYNVGITGSHQNSEKLYWRISTSEPQFVLKMVAYEYMGRDRR